MAAEIQSGRDTWLVCGGRHVVPGDDLALPECATEAGGSRMTWLPGRARRLRGSERTNGEGTRGVRKEGGEKDGEGLEKKQGGEEGLGFSGRLCFGNVASLLWGECGGAVWTVDLSDGPDLPKPREGEVPRVAQGAKGRERGKGEGALYGSSMPGVRLIGNGKGRTFGVTVPLPSQTNVRATHGNRRLEIQFSEKNSDIQKKKNNSTYFVGNDAMGALKGLVVGRRERVEGERERDVRRREGEERGERGGREGEGTGREKGDWKGREREVSGKGMKVWRGWERTERESLPLWERRAVRRPDPVKVHAVEVPPYQRPRVVFSETCRYHLAGHVRH